MLPWALVRRLPPLAVAWLALTGVAAMALTLPPGAPSSGAVAETSWLLRPDRVFDGTGERANDGWAVLVTGDEDRSRRPGVVVATCRRTRARSTCPARRCCRA